MEGDRVGVGCLAASCLECHHCKTDQENYCQDLQFVYNGIFWDGTITYGGYSQIFVADYRLLPSFITLLFEVNFLNFCPYKFFIETIFLISILLLVLKYT